MSSVDEQHYLKLQYINVYFLLLEKRKSYLCLKNKLTWKAEEKNKNEN